MAGRLGSDSATLATAQHAEAQRASILALSGRRALVTGGSGSIGQAICLKLARAGAHVMVGFRSNEVGASRIARQVELEGFTADVFQMQVKLAGSYGEDSITADILVNCAGVTAGRSLGKTSRNDWDTVVSTNLTGAAFTTQACLPYMIEQRWGRVVNVASVVGVDGRLGPTAYAASKAGLIGLTKAAAHELASKGITVNAVAPGFIGDTAMLDAVPAQYKADVLRSIPMGRFGTVSDVADAVLYLVQANYVTGTVLNVSGGYLT